MKTICLLLALLSICSAWDYLLFVQYWPGCWIADSNLNETDFTNNYFVVHGIWPEDTNGSYPSYCNSSAKFELSVLDPIYSNLTKYWTDFENPVEFWEHEYYKHATCAASDPLLGTEFDYFNTGLVLQERYDLYQYLADYGIYPSNFMLYQTQYIYDAIRKNINVEYVLTCDTNEILDEIIICLDTNLNPINCPKNEMNQMCQSGMITINVVYS